MAHSTGPAKSAALPLTALLMLNLESVETGVPVDSMNQFVSASGIPLRELYEVVIPARTLKHRKARRENLNVDESDKLARIARVLDFAVRVFDGLDDALLWMRKPKRRFRDRTPMQLLRTEIGARMVEEMLGQIDAGMFA